MSSTLNTIHICVFFSSSFLKAFRRGFDYSSLEGIPDPREVFEFPFAVLELKLAFSNTDVMSKERLFIPPWFQSLIDEGLLLTMDKFSKYTTGMNTFSRNPGSEVTLLFIKHHLSRAINKFVSVLLRVTIVDISYNPRYVFISYEVVSPFLVLRFELLK